MSGLVSSSRGLFVLILAFWALVHNGTTVHAENEVTVLELYMGNGLVVKIPVTAALFGQKIPSFQNASRMPLVAVHPETACSSNPNDLRWKDLERHRSFVAYILRGGCAFSKKVANVQRAGAALAVVGDSVQAIYESSSTSKYNCALGEAFSSTSETPSGDQNPSCQSSTQCVSGHCILTDKFVNETSQICCAVSRPIQMKASSKLDFSMNQIQLNSTHSGLIGSVFVTLPHSDVLQGATSTQIHPEVLIYTVQSSEWDISMIIIWLFAVVLVVVAARYSSRKEYWLSTHVVASKYDYGMSEDQYQYNASGSNSGHPTSNTSYQTFMDTVEEDSEEEPLHLTAWHALGFLIMSSTMLIVLYYFHVLLIINAFFALSGSLSLAAVIIYPVVAYLFPSSEITEIQLPLMGKTSLAVLSSVLPSIGIGMWWYIRRKYPYMWLVQDIFGACLCLEFVDCIRLPNLRVSTYILVAAFCYDVFFVYLSPYVFGSSVMVSVAASGGNVKIHGMDHCLKYPTSPECQPDTMPLLFKVPLVSSFYEGFAMLGFGDVVLPGMFVSFALRYDYLKGTPISTEYFMITCVTYAIGLLLANIMAVELRYFVAGQPALMYIVPLMLVPVHVYSRMKGENDHIWHNITQVGSSSTPQTSPESDPLVTK